MNVGCQRDRHRAVLGFDNGNATSQFEHCSEHEARIVMIFHHQHGALAGIH
jgi:hypothetical protein